MKDREEKIIVDLARKAKANAPEGTSLSGIIRAIIREGGERITRNSASTVRTVILKHKSQIFE